MIALHNYSEYYQGHTCWYWQIGQQHGMDLIPVIEVQVIIVDSGNIDCGDL
jgi:hypothetical protein